MKIQYKSTSHRKRIYGADTVSQDSIVEEEFNITDLPGLQLWLDSTLGSLYQDSSFSTAVENTNDPVGGWIDKSGNANHAVQSTSDDRPLWGNNVNFNGAGQFLSVPDTDDLELSDTNTMDIFVVVDPTDISSAPHTLFSKGGYHLMEYDDQWIFTIHGDITGWSWSVNSIVGSNPHASIVYNNKLYITSTGDDKIYEYDGNSWSFSGDVGDTPFGFAVYKGKLYVACYGDDNVYEYDGSSWSINGSVGNGPRGLSVYDGKMYAACYASDNVYVYNDDGTWSISGSVGNGPYSLIDHRGKLYVANVADNDTDVFDGSSWTSAGSIGASPRGLAIYKGKMHVACYNSNDIRVYNDDGTWTDTGNVGTNPRGVMHYNVALYAGCYNSSNIYKYSGGSWSTAGNVGTNPLSFSVYDGKLFCVCGGNNRVYEYGTGKSISINHSGDTSVLHIQITSSQLKININKGSYTTVSHSVSLPYNDEDLHIGRGLGSQFSGEFGGNSHNFNGNIKEKIICNSSTGLTALEIENTIEYLIDKWSVA